MPQVASLAVDANMKKTLCLIARTHFFPAANGLSVLKSSLLLLMLMEEGNSNSGHRRSFPLPLVSLPYDLAIDIPDSPSPPTDLGGTHLSFEAQRSLRRRTIRGLDGRQQGQEGHRGYGNALDSALLFWDLPPHLGTSATCPILQASLVSWRFALFCGPGWDWLVLSQCATRFHWLRKQWCIDCGYEFYGELRILGSTERDLDFQYFAPTFARCFTHQEIFDRWGAESDQPLCLRCFHAVCYCDALHTLST